MTLPILSYGHSILRQPCDEIDRDYPALDVLIGNMWETLYEANGCGLAAPQVNLPIRLFLVDSQTTYENLNNQERKEYFSGDTGIKEVFINARITEKSDEIWTDTEGCLSIPTLAEEVKRPWSITITYYDRQFQKHTKTFSGATARIIQHEFDHTEGVLYLDYLQPIRRTLLKNKLKKIAAGKVKVKYPMKFLK